LSGENADDSGGNFVVDNDLVVDAEFLCEFMFVHQVMGEIHWDLRYCSLI
jgi:hypothetical protein